jgi:hypothetical protein
MAGVATAMVLKSTAINVLAATTGVCGTKSVSLTRTYTASKNTASDGGRGLVMQSQPDTEAMHLAFNSIKGRLNRQGDTGVDGPPSDVAKCAVKNFSSIHILDSNGVLKTTGMTVLNPAPAPYNLAHKVGLIQLAQGDQLVVTYVYTPAAGHPNSPTCVA